VEFPGRGTMFRTHRINLDCARSPVSVFKPIVAPFKGITSYIEKPPGIRLFLAYRIIARP
jgi:hypothetical protein